MCVRACVCVCVCACVSNNKTKLSANPHPIIVGVDYRKALFFNVHAQRSTRMHNVGTGACLTNNLLFMQANCRVGKCGVGYG